MDEPSEGGALARHSVDGPYRGDRRDRLVLQRRELASELDAARRSAERAPRLAKHLAVIDDEIRSASAPWIDAVAIETPCRASWGEMRGTDTVRRCHRCQRDVHDLTAMTRSEIESLFSRADDTPCVRLRRRPDGRVVTGDCPVEPPSKTARTLGAVALGAVLGAGPMMAVALATMPAMLAPRPARVEASPRRTTVVAAPRAAVPAVAPALVTPQPIDVRALRSAPEPDVAMGVPTLPSPHAIAPWELDRGIRWVAPQAWEIDRELVDRAVRGARLEGMSALRLVRDIGGRTRVYGVRPAGVPARLGLMNGDVILDVNGRPLGASPDDLLHAYVALRQGDALFVRLLRRGEERMHVYRIVDRGPI